MKIYKIIIKKLTKRTQNPISTKLFMCVKFKHGGINLVKIKGLPEGSPVLLRFCYLIILTYPSIFSAIAAAFGLSALSGRKGSLGRPASMPKRLVITALLAP